MNRKVIITIIVILFLVVITGFAYWRGQISVPPNPPEKEASLEIPEDWKTYRNEKYGFEIKYPADWKVVKEFEGEESTPKWHLAGVFPSPEEVPVKNFNITLQPIMCADLPPASQLCNLFLFVRINMYLESPIELAKKYKERLITSKCGEWMCFEINEELIENSMLGNRLAVKYSDGYWD